MSEGAPQPLSPELSREEIYTQIKKREKWLKGDQNTQTFYYPDGQPFNEQKEDFDLFVIKQQSEERLFTDNLWQKFLEPENFDSDSAKEQYQNLLTLIQAKNPLLCAELQRLAEEKKRIQKEMNWRDMEKTKIPLQEIDKKLQPLLEQAYLILREAGTKPGDVRR